MNKLYKKYLKNEDCNLHTENVVLLAENFGDSDDKIIAKGILRLHEELGHITYELSQVRREIHNRLFPKLQEAKP